MTFGIPVETVIVSAGENYSTSVIGKIIMERDMFIYDAYVSMVPFSLFNLHRNISFSYKYYATWKLALCVNEAFKMIFH
jgi:hypothetical protein